MYTVPDAARLIGATQNQVRGWIQGHRTRGARCEPVLKREYDRLGWRVTLSFKNLIEALFIKSFASVGFSLQSIRSMAEAARDIFDDPHPFARRIEFSHESTSIFARVVDAEGKAHLVNLRKRNYAFEPILQQFLRQPISFGPEGYAEIWVPRPEVAPDVVVSPRHSFGQPVLRKSCVPTRTLVDALQAEGGDRQRVARWYQVKTKQVMEAEAFENALLNQ